MANRILHQSLAEKTYRKVKVLLLNGRYAPGERLLHEQLSRELGVSLTTLREAVRRLESEGYLVSLPRQGTFVRKLTRAEAGEIYDIREMLEALAGRLASVNASSEQLHEMQATMKEYSEALDRGDIKSCIRSDFRFHQQLVEAGGNARLTDMIGSFHLQLSSIIETGPDYLRQARDYLKEHLGILDAVERHDIEQAELLIRSHIRKGKTLLLAQAGL
jgi:DNA-binding GntR family transcriptional regulator